MLLIRDAEKFAISKSFSASSAFKEKGFLKLFLLKTFSFECWRCWKRFTDGELFSITNQQHRICWCWFLRSAHLFSLEEGGPVPEAPSNIWVGVAWAKSLSHAQLISCPSSSRPTTSIETRDAFSLLPKDQWALHRNQHQQLRCCWFPMLKIPPSVNRFQHREHFKEKVF